MTKKRKLTAKQELFVKEYLKDLNATQAAIRAGYSEKSARNIASEHLTKLHISDAIQEALEDRNKKLDVDAAWVLKQAIKLHKRCMQEEQALDEEGNPIGEFTFEHTGAAKSLDMIGKHVDVKAWDNTKNLSGSITLNRHKYLDGRKPDS